MDDPGASTRVEIELTPNESSRASRRRSGAGSTTELTGTDYSHEAPAATPDLEPQPVGESYGDPSVARRKLVVVGAVAAIIALLVGWALGRSGGSSGEEAQPPPSTTEPPGLVTLAPAVVPSTVPVTTRPVVRAGPTTTTPRQWETTTIAVDPVLAALDIRIVTVGGGQIVEVDTSTGEKRSLATTELYQQPPRVNAGDDWILIRDIDNGTSQLVRTGELPAYVDIGDAWSTFVEPGTDLFWRASTMFLSGQTIDVVEIDHEGNETGRAFRIPSSSWVGAADPAGGVVVGAPGGTYHIGLDGARRLTIGNLIALSERTIVATECGDDFSDCGLFAIDRETGQRSQVPLSIPDPNVATSVFDLQSPAYWNAPDLMHAISPDGRWTPIMTINNQQGLGIVDLTTGEYVPLAADSQTSMWWSPDSRALLYRQFGRLMLFDTQQRTSTRIDLEGVTVQAFAVRPSA